jgi:hypothetical protein
MALNSKQFFLKHKDKIERIKAFLLIVIGYGIILNYTLMVIFKVPFLWYGFPAFGIAYYFIMEEFVTFYRKLRAKIYT